MRGLSKSLSSGYSWALLREIEPGILPRTIPVSPKVRPPYHRQISQIGRTVKFWGISNLIVGSILIILMIIYLFSIFQKGSSINPHIKIIQDNKKLLGLIGVETTYESAHLRAALRSTWFPANHHDDDDDHLREPRMAFVFVIGTTRGRRMIEIEQENLKYDDILILKKSEQISRVEKTLAFFEAASNKYDAEYYIKADDHIYLRPDRLASMLSRKKTEALEYIGCKKSERLMNRNQDIVFASGSLYILTSNAVKKLVGAKRGRLQLYKSEDVAVGYVMHKAFVQLEEQRDLCQSNCTSKFIAVSDFSCSGSCNPVTMLKEFHKSTMCSKTPTTQFDQYERFERD